MSTHSPDPSSFSQLLESMADAGFFTGLLPFLLSYVLFFLALKRVPLFSESDDQDKFAALVSIVFSFFVARYVTENPAYQQFFNEYLTFVAVVIIGLLGLLVTLAMIGIKTGTDDKSTTAWGLILALTILVGFFATGGPNMVIPEDYLGNAEILVDILNFTIDSGLIWILVIGGAIAWTLSDGSDSGGDNELGEAVGKMFESIGSSGE